MDVEPSGIETEAAVPGEHRRARATVVLGLALGALAACQSYEPRPLEPQIHRAAWHARTLEEDSLVKFVARLDGAPGVADDGFDPHDGLSLAEGRLVALVFHPDLRLARLRAGLAAASADHAGRWADPQFSVGVMRVTESISDRWVVNPALTFTLPLSGRLAAEEGVAHAEQRAAELRAREAEWMVVFDVQRLWFEWSAAGLRVEETERLVEALDGLLGSTAQLADSGELSRTEEAQFAVELAQRRIRLRRARGDLAVLEQRLRASLGLAPEAPVMFVPTLAPLVQPGRSGDEPTEPSEPGEIDEPDKMGERNPTLARLREEYEVAEESLRREIAKQYPDLTLGPQYEADQGQSRVGLIGGLPLPFLNANRRGIAEARVERELARAAFETKYETLVGRRAAAAAQARSLSEQRADFEAVLVPLVDRQLADAMQLSRLGEGSSQVVLESLTRAQAIKLELIETRAAEATARAELEYLTGPPVPVRSGDETQETP